MTATHDFKFEAGVARATRYLEELRRLHSQRWKREVSVRHLDRILAVEPMASPIYAQALEEWHRLRGEAVNGLSDELFFVNKIKLAGGQWNAFDGVTTRDERRENVRSALKASGLAATKCGRRRGKDVTFGEVFEVIYGQPFEIESPGLGSLAGPGDSEGASRGPQGVEDLSLESI